MKSGIEQSKKSVYTEKAEAWMKPYMPGIVDHPVYSTWAMIRGMENTARLLLQPYLEEGEDGVGCEVSVKHLAPAALGETIRIEATLKEFKHPIVVCHLEAFCENTKIGEGIHKQFVLSKQRYQKFLGKS